MDFRPLFIYSIVLVSASSVMRRVGICAVYVGQFVANLFEPRFPVQGMRFSYWLTKYVLFPIAFVELLLDLEAIRGADEELQTLDLYLECIAGVTDIELDVTVLGSRVQGERTHATMLKGSIQYYLDVTYRQYLKTFDAFVPTLA